MNEGRDEELELVYERYELSMRGEVEPNATLIARYVCRCTSQNVEKMTHVSSFIPCEWYDDGSSRRYEKSEGNSANHSCRRLSARYPSKAKIEETVSTS